MPIYEFECNKCNEKFESFQEMNDDTIPNCPKCNGECTKIISKSSFILKGEGFYINDYKNKGK